MLRELSARVYHALTRNPEFGTLIDATGLLELAAIALPDYVY